MPLTQVSEQAANRIAAILDAYDRRLERYVVSGGTQPNPDTLVADITREVRRSITSGVLEVDPDITDGEIDALILATVESILAATRSATRSAILLRARVEQAATVDTDGIPMARLARQYGPIVAFASLLAAARPRRRREVIRMARNTRVRLPPSTSAYGRMRARTDTAIVRNVRASQVVENRNRATGTLGYSEGDWALLVRDARLGPTDKPCEDVDGKLATPIWARRNPIEHPNCTRLTRPYRLRSGDIVTLLS